MLTLSHPAQPTLDVARELNAEFQHYVVPGAALIVSFDVEVPYGMTDDALREMLQEKLSQEKLSASVELLEIEDVGIRLHAEAEPETLRALQLVTESKTTADLAADQNALIHVPTIDELVELVNDAAHLRLVVLNTGGSLRLGEALKARTTVQHVLCWEGQIHDDAAHLFSTAFVKGIAAGRAPRDAFEAAKKELASAATGPRFVFEEPGKEAQPADGAPVAVGVPHLLESEAAAAPEPMAIAPPTSLSAVGTLPDGEVSPPRRAPSRASSKGSSAARALTFEGLVAKDGKVKEADALPEQYYPLLVWPGFEFPGVPTELSSADVRSRCSENHAVCLSSRRSTSLNGRSSACRLRRCGTPAPT